MSNIGNFKSMSDRYIQYNNVSPPCNLAAGVGEHQQQETSLQIKLTVKRSEAPTKTTSIKVAVRPSI